MIVYFFLRMPPKQQLDKAAWQWAEVTDPDDIELHHIKTAYRINLNPCKQGACRRNCKGNPLCLNHVGERIWFGEIDESSWHDIQDPNMGRREIGMFVGLKNLGATCYVNTFLQLWFHNIAVRKALYQYRDANFNLEKFKQPDKSKILPDSIAGHLQLIFALLENSHREYIDPQCFIDHLGLDTGEQQDAQEFSKLFLALLEDSLSQQCDPFVKNIIQSQFRGQYAYVTTCKECGHSSQCPSMFYELDLNIRGLKTLEECIKDFLQEEKLEGDNQYMCSNCDKKQDAKRAIQLQELPPILNLQLLRFVFDKKTGHKKKLNSFIQFPEVLDMNQFIAPPTKNMADRNLFEELTASNFAKANQLIDNTYHLTAVLIHRGPTAYSGHYVAHIKDRKSKVWHKFNDEEIEKMKGSNLHLGTEDDPQGANTKKGRTPKGYHSSKNAYMLVYTRVGSEYAEMSCSEHLLPQHIKDYVINDNEKFENWVLEMQSMRDHNIESGKEQQQFVKDIFSNLIPVGNDASKLEWLSLSWMSKWLEDPDKVKSTPIDNKPYLCQHQKLDPSSVLKLKCVNTAAASVLYDKYSGGPRLYADDAFCNTCILHQSRLIRTKRRITEDERSIASAIRSSGLNTEECGSTAFWVGKASLRSWKKLALEEITGGTEENKSDNQHHKVGEDETEASGDKGQSTSHNSDGNTGNVELEKDPDEIGTNGQSNKDTQKTPGTSRSRKESTASDNLSETSGQNARFNEDVQCEHDNLDPDPSCRKLVSEHIWAKLKQYFPDCPEYNQSSELCNLCNSQNVADQEIIDNKKEIAHHQKSVLGDLFLDKKRPLHLKVPQEVNIVSTLFVNSWRQFIKDPVKHEPVREILNCSLLCQHGGFLFPPADIPPDLSHHLEDVVYIWPAEWQIIRQCFAVDEEICVVKYEDEDTVVKIVTMPEICYSCLEDRKVQKEKAKYEYKDALIYIRKVPKDHKFQDANESKDNRDDPDFNEASARSADDEPPEKFVKSEDGSRRKSQRHRKVRGEKEVKVSSTHTLKDLKLEIMKMFSVPPFDQNLSLSGELLKRDDSSLGTLKISPGCVIVLQADEPVEDPSALQDLIQASSGPESGFKGTGLLGKGI